MHGILKANAPRGRGKKEDDMQPPSTLLLSTGEFARMCNVSKELLIHYDKVGLLKPTATIRSSSCTLWTPFGSSSIRACP